MAVAASHTGYVQTTGGTGTSLTAPNVPIGAADAARKVTCVVAIGGSGTPTTCSFTIGGQPATIEHAISLFIYIISADLPTGTTANVAGTLDAGTLTTIRVHAFRVIGPVTKHDGVATAVYGSSASVGINETVGGATIAGAFTNAAIGWTYPTEADETFTGFSAALAAASGSSSNLAVSRSGSNTIFLLGIHYRETGPSGTVAFSLDDLVVAATGGAHGSQADVAFTFDELAIEASNLALQASVAFTLDELALEATDIPFEATVAFVVEELEIAALADSEVPEDLFWRTLFARGSGEVIVVLLTISHPSLDEPKRFALSGNGHDVISNGALFRAVYFEPTWISDTERPVRVGLRVPNVDREVGALLDELEDAPTVRMDLALGSNPNDIRESATNLRLLNAGWGAAVVEGELGYRDWSNVPWPALSATPAYARALHK